MIIRVSSLCSKWLLLSTVILCSCITIDKTLGNNLIPTDQDLTLYTATFDLPIFSKPSDSLQTNNHYFIYDSEMPFFFGACRDPLFGLTQAGTVFQFFPYNAYGSSIAYGDNPEPVSLTLSLYNPVLIVLDQNQISIPQNIFIHEVTSDLSYRSAYNNSLLPQDWNPTPISYPGQLFFGTDTIRISLSLDFAQELLNISQMEKDSTLLFLERFKGLYLRTEPAAEGINTGRLNYATSADMVLRYKSSGAETDSIIYYYTNNYGLSYHSIIHSQATVNPQSSENIYYQGYAGLKPYVDFVALTKEIKAWAEQSQIEISKLLINRAEMVLYYDPDFDYKVIDRYPPIIYPYTRTFTDTTSYYLPVDNIRASNADGAINRNKFNYSMNITSYLQSLLKKEEVTEKDNTWLMETTTYEDEYSQTIIYHFSSYSYPLALFKGVDSDAKPILNLTYTVLK